MAKKWDWEFNAATGSHIAQVDDNTRIIRSGQPDAYLYRAEFWGDYSLRYPIWVNTLSIKESLKLLKEEIAKDKNA